jgi:RND family efflux transporter MFP subunit
VASWPDLEAERTVSKTICNQVDEALVVGVLTDTHRAHIAACGTCKGASDMIDSIGTELDPVPAAHSQRPQWIAEVHARAARRRRRLVLGACGLAVASVAVAVVLIDFSGNREHTRSAAQPAGPVTTRVDVHRAQIDGVMTARSPIVLTASADGHVEKVTVKTGDRVTKGQLLAEIDSGQLRSELAVARAKVGDAARSVALIKRLVAQQAATTRELEIALAELAAAKAADRAIAIRLEDTSIRSPIDGVVLDVVVHPGDTVEALRSDIVTVADPTTLAVDLEVPEAQLKDVYVGQACDVVSDSDRAVIYHGVVRDIADEMNRARRTVLTRVDVDVSPDSPLRPGMAVHITFKPRQGTPSQP